MKKIEETGTVVLKHLRGVTGSTSHWTWEAYSYTRPEAGKAEMLLDCGVCDKPFSFQVHSSAAVRRLRQIYVWLGVECVVLFLVLLPDFIGKATMVVDESKPQQEGITMPLFLSLFFSPILAISFLWTGFNHDGVTKLRLVRPDGARTPWVEGHKF